MAKIGWNGVDGEVTWVASEVIEHLVVKCSVAGTVVVGGCSGLLDALVVAVDGVDLGGVVRQVAWATVVAGASVIGMAGA